MSESAAVAHAGASHELPLVQPALQVEYQPLSRLEQQPQDWWRQVLGVVCFDGHGTLATSRGVPAPQVHAAVLGHPAAPCGQAEVWRLEEPLRSGRHGQVQYRCGTRLLFAALAVSAGFSSAAALRAAVESAYRDLFVALRELGFPHALRFWNFLPDIHAESAGAERYWHFNSGRQDAFLRSGRPIDGAVPAASVLGSAAGTAFTVYCIAGLQPPIALENPRQCNPWAYPSDYGPRSPTFARACLDASAAQTLFISGTASIVGHRSAHPDDPLAQTRETLNNIRALLAAANERLGEARHAAERLYYKVYVRHPEHQPLIERELRRQVGPAPPVLFLRADVCRRELLVEIEAVGT